MPLIAAKLEALKLVLPKAVRPPPGITWPVPPIIAREQLGTTGPDLPPVT